MKPLMFTLTGPSCGGKTTLMQYLVETYPDTFCGLRSVTTRSLRQGEEDGSEYQHVTEDVFQIMLEEDLFCQAVKYKGVHYGTLKEELQGAFDAGKVPIRVVEPSGVGQFQKSCAPFGAEVFPVYVDADPEVLMSRWLRRYTDEVTQLMQEGARVEFDINFWVRRMTSTFMQEINWLAGGSYKFYFDTGGRDFERNAYMLSRIAMGNLPMANATLLSPVPQIGDQAA